MNVFVVALATPKHFFFVYFLFTKKKVTIFTCEEDELEEQSVESDISDLGGLLGKC